MRQLFIILVSMLSLVVLAQDKNSRPSSYNYQRGVEAIQNKNLDEAQEYLNKEVDDNPKNGYAYSWIAMVRAQQNEYGRALTSADLAIKNLPKKDAEYLYFAIWPISIVRILCSLNLHFCF